MSAPDLRRIADVAPLIQSGAVSLVDLVQSCTAQIDARPELTAFITRLDTAAHAAAELAHEIRSDGIKPLHGIPIVKI